MTYRRIGRERSKQWTVMDIADLADPFLHSNVGAAYVEKSEGYRVVVDLDRIPATEIIFYIYGLANESTGDVEIYDITNSQQLAEILNLGNADAWHNSGWTALPANVLGTTITITLRLKGSATEDIEVHRLIVMVRRN